MSELHIPQEGFNSLESIDFRVVASGSLDPSSAAELQRRVCEVFCGIDGLSFSVTVGHGEVSDRQEIDDVNKEFKQWLDSDLTTSLQEAGVSTRTYNCIGREGIKTFRQALLYGESRISDIRNLGNKSMVEVRQIIENNPFGQTLQKYPSLKYAATICDDISQVPAFFAIDTYGAAYPFDSVGDVLAMPLDDIVKNYVRRWSYSNKEITQTELAQAHDRKIELEKCAREFAYLKTRQSKQS